MIVWTNEDQNAAYALGWGIFDNSTLGLRIEKLDDPSSVGLSPEPRFEDDAEALAYVKTAASYDNPLAAKALDFISQENAKRA